MRYEPFGPYVLQRERYKPSPSAFRKLWNDVKASSPLPVAHGVGIYLLSIREEGHQPMPWYVGRTCGQGFQLRFTQKMRHFTEILTQSEKGELEVTFLALMAKSGLKLRKATDTKSGIDANKWLERKLIDDCYGINSKLINVADAKYRKAIVVPGYLNSSDELLGQSSKDFMDLLRRRTD